MLTSQSSLFKALLALNKHNTCLETWKSTAIEIAKLWETLGKLLQSASFKAAIKISPRRFLIFLGSQNLVFNKPPEGLFNYAWNKTDLLHDHPASYDFRHIALTGDDMTLQFGVVRVSNGADSMMRRYSDIVLSVVRLFISNGDFTKMSNRF